MFGFAIVYVPIALLTGPWIALAITAALFIAYHVIRVLPDDKDDSALPPAVDNIAEEPQDRRGIALRIGAPAQTLRFEYSDAHGEITDRSVVNWTEYPQHIVGHCLTRRASRTFRKDCVLTWHEGRHYLADPIG